MPTETRYVIQRKHKVTGEVEYRYGLHNWHHKPLFTSLCSKECAERDAQIMCQDCLVFGVFGYELSVVPVEYTFEIKLQNSTP